MTATEDDKVLFRKAMQGVRRLQPEPRQQGLPRRPKPRARFARQELGALLQESMATATSPLLQMDEAGDVLQFRRDAVSKSEFRRLRSGQLRVDGEIDLHGLTAAAAEPALRAFLTEAQQQRARVVRVIHGKGLRSGHRGPVLKLVTSHFLLRVGAVLAFASVREAGAGSGAILVLLADRPRR